MSAIVDFLAGQGVDGRGRTLDEVLGFDDRALERHHDFIQWLFPLLEGSAAVPGSPVLTVEDIAAIRLSARSRANLERAADRLAAFYRSTDAWLVPFDHNHLRITRIIKSLRRLVGEAEADAFRSLILERVRRTNAPVDPSALAYWHRA